MKKNMKRMSVVAALAIVVWGAVPAGADDVPVWDYASSFDEGLILGESFESLSPGDSAFAGSLIDAGGSAEVRDYLVNNDNPDLNGNHLDGDSSGAGGWSGFTFDGSPADHGAPSNGSYYIEGTVDNLQHNISVGVWNSALNTQYNIGFGQARGWGWSFGTSGEANSGLDILDLANPQRSINKVNVEDGFVTSYRFQWHDLVTGASWGHGGQDGIPNHLPGFGTPTLRLFYDRRAGQNTDMDDFRIATMPWLPVIPEPTSFALLGLGSLLMLRRRV